MIYLSLFLNFLMIGAVSFGGGYGMISLLREVVLSHGWLGEEEFLSFIAVSESTPGPLAVNMATFIGASQGGFPGALVATLGVVLPSFLILLLLSAVLGNLLRYAGVNAFLCGVRPAVVAMILATGLLMFSENFFSFRSVGDVPMPEGRALLLFGFLIVTEVFSRRVLHRAPSPILLILLSAGAGLLMFGVFA